MGKKASKILSVFLSVCLITFLFPAGVMADGASGAGATGGIAPDTAWYTNNTGQDAFSVGTAAELAGLASLVNSGTDFEGKNVTLTANIELNATEDWTDWALSAPENAWAPIGEANHAFKGVFDGGGYTVSGIYVNSDSNYAGLFGYVSGGTVKNLKIAASFINGRDKVGGVAGYIDAGSEIAGCDTSGTVGGTGNHIGGLAGYAAGGSEVTDSKNTGAVGLTGYHTGGLVGYALNCAITGSYNTGAVKGTSNIGGITGSAYNSVITASYNRGTVGGFYSYAGGLTGYASDSTISDSYNAGGVTGGSYTGGAAGYFKDGSLTNNYYLKDAAASGIGNNAGADGAQPKTMEQMTSASFPAALGTSYMQDLFFINAGYPLLLWQGGPLAFAGGSGGEGDPYLIETPLQLRYMAYQVNNDNAEYGSAHYKLTGDINLEARWAAGESGAALTSGAVWTPIGLWDSDNAENSAPFKGVFDGDGCIISGLYINDDTLSGAGLFGYTNGAVIKNVTVTDAYVKGKDNTGGIVGYAVGGSIERSFSMAAVSGSSYGVGGVAGSINANGSIADCYNTGPVKSTSDQVGGIAGRAMDSDVRNCYNTGPVSGSHSVGGVVGVVDAVSGASVVTNCYYLAGMAAAGIGDGSGEAAAKDGNEMKTDAFAQALGDAFLPSTRHINGGYPLLLAGGFAGGSGVEGDPWLIASPGQLRYLSCIVRADNEGYAAKHYALTRDIRLFAEWAFDSEGNLSVLRGRQWMPIGWWADTEAGQYPFKGIFDGRDHTISGICIKIPRNSYDPHESNCYGLFGGVDGGTVRKLSLKDSVIWSDDTLYHVGGVAGLLTRGGVIDNCDNLNAAVKGEGYAAGIVAVIGRGYEGGASVLEDGRNVVSNCSNAASVRGKGSIGGVAALVRSGPIMNWDINLLNMVYCNRISDCENSGTITSSSAAMTGGIYGDSAATVAALYVEDCRNTGTIIGSADTQSKWISGIGYGRPNIFIKNCENAGTISNEGKDHEKDLEAAGIACGFAGLIEGCRNTGSVTSLLQAGGIATKTFQIIDCVNSGTITTTHPEYHYSRETAAGGILACGLDQISMYPGYEYKISGCVNAGTVRSAGGNAGGIVGRCVYGRVSLTIEDCYNAGSVNGSDQISGTGGVLGWGDYANDHDQLFEPLRIISCYNTGPVSGTADVGGVAGFTGNGVVLVSDSYNTGPVSGRDNVGGVAGRVSNQKGSVENCYNTGTVSGRNNVGIVAGNVAAGTPDDPADDAAVINCYYLNTAEGQSIGAGAGETIGRHPEQFKGGMVAHQLQKSRPETIWGHTQLRGSEFARLAAFDPAVKRIVRVGFYDDMDGDGEPDLLAYSYALQGGGAVFPDLPEENTVWKDSLGVEYTESSIFTSDTSLFLIREGGPEPPSPALISITPPAAIRNVPNGTVKTAEALGLPSTVVMVTNYGNVNAAVSWEVDECAYDPENAGEQTFTVEGDVSLPAGVENPDSVSLSINIEVTVLAASAIPVFIAVTNITGVPGTATAGVDLTLTGTVEPANATNQTIVWSVQSAGATGATVNGNTLSAAAAGAVTVRATITNGLTESSDYTQDFGITVSDVPAVPTLSITTTALADATVGTPYSQNIDYTYTGIGTLTFSADDLPNGLSIDSEGLISGTPAEGAEESSPYSVEVEVTDGALSDSEIYSLTVRAAPAVTYTLTISAGDGGRITAGSSGKYPENASISLAAAADTNYRFDSWSSSNGGFFANAASASTTFTMPAKDTTVTAGFTYIGGGNQGSGRPATETSYTITAAARAGGSITPSGSVTVTAGKDRAFTITAGEGYKIEDVLVDGVSVGAVSAYTFKNVEKDHSITASFKKTETAVSRFTDVNPDDWFHDNVLYVYENGLMSGTAPDAFDPSGVMTRGMSVAVLYRLSGDTGSYQNAFSDIVSGSYYENAAAWAHSAGIARGVGSNQFAPDSPVSREQLAVMLYNYARYKGYDVSVGEDTNILSYNDAFSISEYAYAALQWACGAGILQGDTKGNLNPQSSATRAEVAAMLQRFIEKAAQ